MDPDDCGKVTEQDISLTEMAIAGTVDAQPTDVIVEHSPSKDLLCALFASFQ